MKYCANCGGEVQYGPWPGETRDRHTCGACQLVHYQNPKIVVATLPLHEQGLVLIRRGIEPGYGLWGYPGGFMELGETVEEAAIRETLEETGYDIAIGHSIGIYSRPNAGVVVLAFAAVVTGGAPRLSPETLEVQSFPLDQSPWDEMAFPTVRLAVEDWLTHQGAHYRTIRG